MNISIDMTDADFGMMTEDAVWVKGSAHIIDALEPHDPESGPSLDYAMAYWLEPGWTTVLMAKAFLQAQGEPFDLFYDHEGTDGTGSWVLLTDYITVENRAHDLAPHRSTTIWRIDYQSTDFERYDTDLNHRMEAALKSVGTVREADGGTNGEVADNGFIVETSVYDATQMGTIVRAVLGERPYTLRDITHDSNRVG